jgi:hypothetical protein
MIKASILFTLIFFSISTDLVGQKISNIDFDSIKLQTKDSTSRYYYPKLTQRFLELDTTLFLEDLVMIYYGYVFTDEYNPFANPDKNEAKFMALYEKAKFKKAIPYGQKALFDNPVNLNILIKLSFCYRMLGDKFKTTMYAKLYFDLLYTISQSGDGKSVETAYVIINIDDEIELIEDLELVVDKHEVIEKTHVFVIDTLEQINKEGEIEKLYINLSKPYDYFMHNIIN